MKSNTIKPSQDKTVEKIFKEALKQIDECPFFPKYPVMFLPITSKIELKRKLIEIYEI